MERRKVLKLFGLGSLITLIPIGIYKGIQYVQSKAIFRIKKPISVYITWAAHDNLSDNKPLTSELAMKELYAIQALKKKGVRFDYFVLDEGWADPSSGCRKFNEKYWPNGYDEWLQNCSENNLLPGLWFPVNILGMGQLFWMQPLSEWKNSVCNSYCVSLSKGDFLKYHIQTFQLWYDRGIRLFKLDFTDFSARTDTEEHLSTDEIIENNQKALYQALSEFRLKNSEAVFLAYNGFGGEMKDTYPVFTKTIDPKWLNVFDSMYSGDPRPSDVPCINFWRSKEIYSDHMVRQFEFNEIPLQRIDNSSFMIGNTGTCYFRQKEAWKGMLILSLARGGWINTYYGDLSLLNDEDGIWFAKAQTMYSELQFKYNTTSFGSIPGSGNPYGYISQNENDGVVTLVNPSQKVTRVSIPKIITGEHSILFSDIGYIPKIEKNELLIGPEQLVVIGCGKFATEQYQMGVQNDVRIPQEIQALSFSILSENPGHKALQIKNIPADGFIRIIFSQKEATGRPHRTKGEAPPTGKSMGNYLRIEAFQNKNRIPVRVSYDKQIWSGLSWAAGEIPTTDLNPELPLNIHYDSTEVMSTIQVNCSVFFVKYID